MIRLCVAICLSTLVFAAIPDGTRFTIVHVTDVHGWIAGHPHNSTLNTDFGDFASLLQHMYGNSFQRKEELLVFDSGDQIEGTGLSDASDIHGQFIFPVMAKIQNYTALTMGNHDIGHPATVDLMEKTFIPHFNDQQKSTLPGRYLTANSHMKNSGNFIGEPYYVFETYLGSRILVIGMMYNFTQNANNTKVVVVKNALKEPWFQKAMNEPNIDLIVATIHIDPQAPPEIEEVYNAVRAVHANTPFILFSGHRHVLYFQQYDSQSFTLESGKYFEQLGLVRFEMVKGQMKNMEYEWINTSLDNFYQLAEVEPPKFLTPLGLEIKNMIQEFYSYLNLNQTLGCSLITYNEYLPPVAPNSLYFLYIEDLVPQYIYNRSFTNKPYFVTNTAALRYDLYSGRVCINDVWTISPFKDTFGYYPNITGTNLKKFVQIVNDPPTASKLGIDPEKLGRTGHSQYDSAPNFYFSLEEINDATIYDIILSTYDCQTVQPAFPYLGLSDTYYSYPSMDSTTAWYLYVLDNMPCRSNCACSYEQ